MKKVLTILAVLVLVAGFAFAAEEHKIHIKADVTEIVPAFQLSYSTVKTNSTSPASYAAATPYAPNAADTAAIDVGFNLDEDGSVLVTATIGNAAKQKQNYTLTFKDGVFAVARNGVTASQTHAPKTIAATAAASAFTGTSEITASGAVITVKFNGTKCTANSTIGTATYTYEADNTIDPGTYYANLVMEVATV